MVSYGPWTDGQEYEETWTWTPDPLDSEYMTVENAISPDPGVPWEGAGGLTMQRDATPSGFGNESRTAVPAVGYEEPGYGTDVPSQEAWATMLASSGVGGSGLHMPLIKYRGSVDVPTLPSGLLHSEEWTGYSAERGGEFYVRTGSTNWNALAGATPTPPDAIGIEFEESYSSTISRAVSLDIDFTLGGDGRWHLFMDGPNGEGPSYEAVDDGFRLDSSTVLFDAPDALDLGNSGTHSFDVATLNTWKDEWAAAGGLTFVDPSRGPKFAVTWTGDWPEDSMGPDKDYDLPGMTITLTYRWQVSRWRWIYADVVPGRLKVPVDGAWKYAVPVEGENGGAGRLKVLVNGTWQYADSLHVNVGDDWAYPNP